MLVSIIIPNYNHMRFLKERIESVLAQSYQDFELIILDDCSTDGSRDIIEQYRSHPKVSIYYNKQNSGSTFAQWNKGVSMAKGQLIWIAESDDSCKSNFLEELVPKFEASSSLVLAYCQSSKMNDNGEITGSWLNWTDDIREGEKFYQDFEIEGIEYIEKYLVYKNTIPNASAVVFKKDIYVAVGGAAEDIKYCSDWLTWLKILVYGNIAYCKMELNQFRYHNKSVIAKATDTQRFYWKYDIIMRERYANILKNFKGKGVKKIYTGNKELKKKCIADEAWFHRHNKRYTKAIYYYLKRLLMQ